MRTETDFLGSRKLPAKALYGLQALRASENFPDRTPFHLAWYKATGSVKLACYLTYRDFKQAAANKFQDKPLPFTFFSDDIVMALVNAAGEVSKGMHFEHFIVPAISGGAGTSINMNVNEIISNRALLDLGSPPGAYGMIDPITHANVFQSTNDVIPTALRVAAMLQLGELETAVNNTRFVIEQIETAHFNDLRIGYTQMQEAVPTSFGKLFSTYSEALSRDWWRISKCLERIKMVNLGGGAVGTGLGTPRYFIMEVVPQLQKLTGLPVTRSENLPDATSNLDAFVEVHAILKSHAVNLEKMTSDIRLLASDLFNGNNRNEPLITIPPLQVGSTIMPGKVNPVIPEFVISAAHKIYANDMLITSLCGAGCLELNAYLPVIGHALLESIDLLIAANAALKNNLLSGITVNASVSRDKLFHSPVITTALLPYIGYHKCTALATHMRSSGDDIITANKTMQMVSPELLTTLLKPDNLLKMGYSVTDFLNS
jgi:aspartate ammonia-lyase